MHRCEAQNADTRPTIPGPHGAAYLRHRKRSTHRFWGRALASAALGISCYSAAAWACKCPKREAAVHERERMDVIFSGIMRSHAPADPAMSKPGQAPRQVSRFEILEHFKAPAAFPAVGESIEIVTSTMPGACGRSYEPGETYLIYAWKKEFGWYDNACTRSQRLDDAKDDVEMLRHPEKFAHIPRSDGHDGCAHAAHEAHVDPPLPSTSLDNQARVEPATPDESRSPSNANATSKAHPTDNENSSYPWMIAAFVALFSVVYWTRRRSA